MGTGPLKIFHIDMNFVNLRVDYLRHWLEKLAKMGYDAILWELEDKVRWETCPECVWPEAMSKLEFKELLAYSRSLGLEPIPLLQTVGHAEYVLKTGAYDTFKELPDHHDCYCASNPDVRAFLARWTAEYLELFGDIRYFHLGGDEAYVFGKCPVCSARSNKNQLYAEHLLAVAKPLLDKGVRPGVWCDMLLHHPDQMGDIPKDFVIWDWNYWSHDGAADRSIVWGHGMVDKADVTAEMRARCPELLDANGDFVPFYTADFLRNRGYDVILCSSSRSHGDTVFCPQWDLHNRNVAAAARKTVQAGLLGNCVTSWAVRLNPYETQELTLALVPFAMEHPELPFDALLRALGREFFGMDASDCFAALTKISAFFLFASSGSTAIQWNHGWKDSVAAPANYVEDLLKRWRHDDTLRQHKRTTRDAQDQIAAGLSQLGAFTERAHRNLEFLDCWFAAANMQFWMSKLACMVFDDEADKSQAGLLKHWRRNFVNYLKTGETPRSAEKNASLVFDPLLEYFQSR